LSNVTRLQDVRTIADGILLGLRSKLVAAIRDDAEKSYMHGYKEGLKEEGITLKKSDAAFEETVSWDLADQQAMDNVVDHGLILSDDYYDDVNRKIQSVIAESFADQRSIPSVVRSLRDIVQTETWKLTRIARTEIINATNEGRLSSFKKIEANKKLLFEQGKIPKKPKEHKYTLIVALGARTCDAHRELARKIPRKGLPLSELIQLQNDIGSRHGMRLTGNSLLHPNQRTVISRVV